MSYRLIKANKWANSNAINHISLGLFKISPPQSILVCSFCKCFQEVHHIKRDPIHYILRNNSTFIRLNEVASKIHKKRRNFKKYVELIQVENKNGNSAKKKLAKIKNSSPTHVLKKLGISTSTSSELSVKSSTNVERKNIEESKLLSTGVNKETLAYVNNTNIDDLSEQLDTTSNALNNSKDYLWSVDVFNSDTVNSHDEFHDKLSVESDFQDTFLSNKNFLLPDVEPELEEYETINNPSLNLRIESANLLQDHELITPDSTTGKHSKILDFSEEEEKKLKKKHKTISLKEKYKLICEDAKHTFLDGETRKLHRLYLNLLSYLDVCINRNLTYNAHAALLYYSRKIDLSTHKNSINLFNPVLHAWASNRNWEMLTQLLNFMEQKGPKPNLQSYAAALECLVRMGKDKKKLKEVLRKIKEKNLCIENIVEDCLFIKDQKEMVLEGIRSVHPNFKPMLKEKSQFYNCELLQSLNTPMPDDRHYDPCRNLFTSQQLKELGASQLDTESKGQITIRSIATTQFHPEKYSHWRKLLNNCEKIWRDAIRKKFLTDVENLKRKFIRYPDKISLYPYMTALNPEDYVNFMMKEIEAIGQLSEGFSSVLSSMQMNLGRKIMEHYFLQKKKENGFLDKIKILYEKFCEYYSDPKLISKHIPRQYWRILQNIHSDGPNTDMYSDKLWPTHLLLNIGQFLYEILMKTIYIDTNLFKSGGESKNLNCAFFTVYRKHNIIKIREEIKPHPTLAKLYKLANYDQLTFDAAEIPMISPPLPWTSIHSGGFLLASKILIRQPHTFTYHSLQIDKINAENFYAIWDSMNQLAECPWKINQPILDLIIKIFNNKGNVELDIPPPVSECQPLPSFKDVNKKMLGKIIQKRAAIKQKRSEMYSLWCDMLYKLSIANQFRNRIVWFPHNIDFRGRAYPCPPHFNHLGSDVSRGLLLFAKGEELGGKGLQWLKIHLINLTGLKKRSSLKERLEYCDEIIDDIMDSADKPLTGRKWWMKSDEPWQTLACCMELTKCLRSPDPEKYICHFPVHQDGSCNGLQHYAALGRDKQGAKQVNLSPNNIPQDVYSKVAEMVEEARMKDAVRDVKIAQVLEGFVSRKVVKQPVMTTVYGVTRYGAHEQIMRQLKDIPDFPVDYQWKAASYLVNKIFHSLQTMFSATKQIQDWLTESAKLISKDCLQPVQWVTPLGLPVFQPYFKFQRIQSTLEHKKKNQQHNKKNKPKFITFEVSNTRKQKNAFAPNYIHSLDSTHMMLTSLHCQRAGINFASVHDCFWTHPNTVDIMNKICREQFVALHSQPLLMNLRKDLIEKNIPERVSANPEDYLPIIEQLNSIPQRGQFILEDVLKSMYFFS